MPVGHYENFPVASLLLPAPLRHSVSVIYRFARSAELRRLEAGRSPSSPLFRELAEVIGSHRLPLRPFHDLLDAFSQDVTKLRYANFGEVMDYCRRSADPVGRLMLHLYGEAKDDNVARSDAICSALQLINFWQDVEV